MHTVAKPGRFGLELAHRRLSAIRVARDDYDASAHSREFQDCGFADA
jgi:hypothetical protein